MHPPQHLVLQCQEALAQAERLGVSVSLSDHAHALVLRALLIGTNIGLEQNDEERLGVLTDGIRVARQAFSLAEASESSEVMQDALWSIAALEWTRLAFGPAPAILNAADVWESHLRALSFVSADNEMADLRPLLWGDTIPAEFAGDAPSATEATERALYDWLREIIGDVWQNLTIADSLDRSRTVRARDAYRRYVRLVAHLRVFWAPGGIGYEGWNSPT